MRLLVALLVAITVLGNSAAAKARPQSARGDSVEFDIVGRAFVRTPNAVRYGESLKLKVLHPNLFRDDYTLKMKSEDYHVLTLPDDLKGLAAKAGTDESDLGFSETSSAKPLTKLTLPPLLEVKEEFKAVVDSAEELNRWFGEILERTRGADPSARLRLKLTDALDDRAARLATLADLDTLTGNWTKDSSLAAWFATLERSVPAAGPEWKDLSASESAEAVNRLGRLLEEFSGFSSDLQSRWNRVHAKWYEAYSDWQVARDSASLGKAGDKYADACDASVKLIDTGMQDLLKSLAARQNQLLTYVTLSSAAVDIRRTPAILERTATVKGDEIVVTVIVSPHGTTGQSDLPQQPGLSYDKVIYVTRRWSLDVTAGFAGTTLLQHNYYVGRDSIVHTGASDKTDVHPSIFLESVFAFRQRGAIDWGVVLPAAGVTIGSPVRYLLGGGLQFFEQVRVNLLGGVALGAVNVPNGESVGEKLVTKDLDVKSVVRQGWFASAAVTIALPPAKTSDSKDK
jgi:hypothetical protein